MLPQLIELLQCLNQIQKKIKIKKGPKQKGNKSLGGWERNHVGRLPPRSSVATATWSLLQLDQLLPAPEPLDGQGGGPRRSSRSLALASLLFSPSFYPSISVCPRTRNRHRNLARCSAGRCRRLRPPQANRRYQNVRREVLYHLAQPCFPGCGHLDGIINLLQHHHRDTDRTPTPISSPSSSLRPRRLRS